LGFGMLVEVAKSDVQIANTVGIADVVMSKN
jgi:hypothetical protein